MWARVGHAASSSPLCAASTSDPKGSSSSTTTAQHSAITAAFTTAYGIARHAATRPLRSMRQPGHCPFRETTARRPTLSRTLSDGRGVARTHPPSGPSLPTAPLHAKAITLRDCSTLRHPLRLQLLPLKPSSQLQQGQRTSALHASQQPRCPERSYEDRCCTLDTASWATALLSMRPLPSFLSAFRVTPHLPVSSRRPACSSHIAHTKCASVRHAVLSPYTGMSDN